MDLFDMLMTQFSLIRWNKKQVWKALREIPPGQTATYKELALKLGATAQEIGEACAANSLAVVIPCHRVIRSDGGLAGYSWGVNRKRLLLLREQEMFPDPQSLFAMPAITNWIAVAG
jgi:O-6-methylguanine DNA methyltransferase